MKDAGEKTTKRFCHFYLFGFFIPPSLILSACVCSAQVRIFPYLIGRESAFADNLKWMACANKGLRRSDKHSDIRGPWRYLGLVWLATPVCVCGGSSSFCQKGMKWYLGVWRGVGVRGEAAVIPLPVRVSSPRLLTADGCSMSCQRSGWVPSGRESHSQQNTSQGKGGGLWSNLTCPVWGVVTHTQLELTVH